MNRRQDNPGFTLIEMIVAMTIIAAIMSMVYGSYAAATRSMQASGTRMACVERGCFALRLMARQLRCAFAPAPHPSASDLYLPEANPDAPPDNIAAASPAESSFAVFRGDSADPRGEILSFLTSGGPGVGPDGRGLSFLTYRFDRAASTLSVSRQDRSGPSHSVSAQARFDPVLRDVTDVALGFYDGRSWERTWDARRRHGLPRAVRIELTVTDEPGRPHRLQTIVPILQQTHWPSGDNRRTFVTQP